MPVPGRWKLVKKSKDPRGAVTGTNTWEKKSPFGKKPRGKIPVSLRGGAGTGKLLGSWGTESDAKNRKGTEDLPKTGLWTGENKMGSDLNRKNSANYKNRSCVGGWGVDGFFVVVVGAGGKTEFLRKTFRGSKKISKGSVQQKGGGGVVKFEPEGNATLTGRRTRGNRGRNRDLKKKRTAVKGASGRGKRKKIRRARTKKKVNARENVGRPTDGKPPPNMAGRLRERGPRLGDQKNEMGKGNNKIGSSEGNRGKWRAFSINGQKPAGCRFEGVLRR